ncbi:MAG: hypothetical protein ABL931_05785 [Usitatibacteraceae bacterium]
MATVSNNTLDQAATTEVLCELLLRIVGRNTGRMGSARRHVEVLDAAVPFMTLQQRTVARRRIQALETKWGPLLSGIHEGPKIEEIQPITRVARWLSTRKVPERHLKVLHRAAIKFAEGESSMSVVMDHAFAFEFDHVLVPVGFDSFKEWMFELRIAQRLSPGVYGKGAHCDWWVDQMAFSKAKTSSYHACLEQAAELRLNRASSAKLQLPEPAAV